MKQLLNSTLGYLVLILLSICFSGRAEAENAVRSAKSATGIAIYQGDFNMTGMSVTGYAGASEPVTCVTEPADAVIESYEWYVTPLEPAFRTRMDRELKGTNKDFVFKEGVPGAYKVECFADGLFADFIAHVTGELQPLAFEVFVTYLIVDPEGFLHYSEISVKDPNKPADLAPYELLDSYTLTVRSDESFACAFSYKSGNTERHLSQTTPSGLSEVTTWTDDRSLPTILLYRTAEIDTMFQPLTPNYAVASNVLLIDVKGHRLEPEFAPDVYDYVVDIQNDVTLTVDVQGEPGIDIYGDCGDITVPESEFSIPISVHADTPYSWRLYTIRTERRTYEWISSLLSDLSVTQFGENIMQEKFSRYVYDYTCYYRRGFEVDMDFTLESKYATTSRRAGGMYIIGEPDIPIRVVSGSGRDTSEYVLHFKQIQETELTAAVSTEPYAKVVSNAFIEIFSDEQEQIAGYSFTGQRLFRIKKEKGKITCPVSDIQRPFIVAGSSGWSKVVY